MGGLFSGVTPANVYRVINCPCKLRLRSFFVKTDWSAMFGTILTWLYRCRTTVIFGTLEDGSMEVNRLAFNNCFNYRNVFQNGINALQKKNGFKNPDSLSKRSNFVWFGLYDFIQISLSCSTNIFNGMYEETSDFQGQH